MVNKKLLYALIPTLAAILAVSAVLVAATVSFQVQLPFTYELQFLPCKLIIPSDLAEPIKFTYNTITQQYENARVQVRNTDLTKSHTGMVEIKLYSNQSVVLATGTVNTGVISAGLTVEVTVPLQWQIGYTIAALEGVVQPPQQIIPLS